MEIYNSFVASLSTIIAIIQSISATNSNSTTLKFKNGNSSQSVSESETLPRAEAWSEEPLCPLWGPMESFYREGIEKERVKKMFNMY